MPDTSRPIILGDEFNRSWTAGIWDDPAMFARLGAAIGILVTRDDEGHLQFLGNASVISFLESAAICLAAAHSFEPLKREQLRRRGRPTLSHLGPGADGNTTIDPRPIKLMLDLDGQHVQCDIDQINYQSLCDLVVFTASIEHRAIFTNKIAVDLSMPSVGDEVAVLSHKISDISHSTEPGKTKYISNLCFRTGIVTAVTNGRGRLGQHWTFSTTIPVVSGMSGGPIIRKPPHQGGGDLIMLGIVSSDFSAAHSFKSFVDAGDSVASMLWPAMGLGIHTLVDGQQRFQFLSELLARGWLYDRSDRVKVAVEQKSDYLAIEYRDERSAQPVVFQFHAARHPGRD